MPKIGQKRHPNIEIGPDGVIEALLNSATNIQVIKLGLAAEAGPRFVIRADGRLMWGDGGGTFDTLMQRHSANVLRCLDAFYVDEDLWPAYAQASGTTGLRMRVSGDTQSRISIDNTGKIEWGPGNAALDCDLRRSSAGRLYSTSQYYIDENYFYATGVAAANYALRSKVTGDTNDRIYINAGGQIYFGPGNAALDVYIRRDTANSIAMNVNSIDGVVCRNTAVAADTFLMVYDVDNATLERVTVGAANSGGAGFKLLRIPN